jgi:hypothetical protein
MPKKEKIVKVERLEEGKDTPTIIEFTATEWALVNAYFDENMNQTRAYLKVFPTTKYDSARVDASKYFAKSNIKGEIIHRLKQDAMSSFEVLKRMGDMARASHYPFIKIAQDGFVYFDFSNPEAIKNLHLIKKIKTKRERRIEGVGESAEEWEGEWVEVELHDAAAALRDLGKYHKLFTERVENSGYVLNINWDDLTTEQMIRLRNGEDPDVIKKEIDERKSSK